MSHQQAAVPSAPMAWEEVLRALGRLADAPSLPEAQGRPRAPLIRSEFEVGGVRCIVETESAWGWPVHARRVRELRKLHGDPLMADGGEE